ncbi:MAG: hypothetical protein MUE85_17425 [Microscillaceae bacterium]|nr:hypothetical protein [Microscillaceae bacterium]
MAVLTKVARGVDTVLPNANRAFLIRWRERFGGFLTDFGRFGQTNFGLIVLFGLHLWLG